MSYLPCFLSDCCWCFPSPRLGYMNTRCGVVPLAGKKLLPFGCTQSDSTPIDPAATPSIQGTSWASCQGLGWRRKDNAQSCSRTPSRVVLERSLARSNLLARCARNKAGRPSLSSLRASASLPKESYPSIAKRFFFERRVRRSPCSDWLARDIVTPEGF
ncbi:hypothetical protein BU24DRAFT_162451 [Aaosphaeria arxii CBS 175.79]|uniref:Uncharacterized protein n=1 Tax=Aaosphaeria arxii CBS 175.79 TaxID=1450172 RepID=A0A6A5XYF6_9PLEO|nr:uncharacterized protein BU24DRAFT_162451 [Aaosphaeria arxii CBS 175.79]KAF2017963.1 hypothetical protein BU24DRAFT_162451 [Aaosphaeria arxii CBS 175.79]